MFCDAGGDGGGGARLYNLSQELVTLIPSHSHLISVPRLPACANITSEYFLKKFRFFFKGHIPIFLKCEISKQKKKLLKT